MDHHTAVHIVGGAARRILGLTSTKQERTNQQNLLVSTSHTTVGLLVTIWTPSKFLQTKCLGQVSRTEKTILPRHEADKKHGFDLYQGGAPKAMKFACSNL